MRQRIILLLVLCLFGMKIQAQQINRAEYFIDTDNGVGTGTPINITTAGNQVNQSFNIPVNAISTGFHRLGVRCRNVNGTWSEQLASLFYVLSNSSVISNANINRAEYFIDSDPGTGLGSPITINTPGVSVSQNIGINIGALGQGFHRMVIRVRSSAGVWSEQLSNLFFVLPSAPAGTISNITKAEYFIDNDPGVGNGTIIPAFTEGVSVSSAFSIPITSLSQGFHRLNVRVRDGFGKWSHHLSSLFYVLPNAPSATNSTITKAEYFVDNDPGVGNGTSIIPFSSGNSVSSAFSVPVNTLSQGFHRLNVRIRDGAGKWSHHLASLFYVLPNPSTTQQQQIVAAEWFVDADPGVGNGTAITPITAGNNINILTDISIASLNLIDPNHTLSIRVKDQTGKWSLHLTKPFQVCQPASTANFTFSALCPNQAVTFTNSSSNVPNGATYQWDFNNDGVIDANGIGPHQFTYNTSGNFNAVLRIIEENCAAQVTKPINIPTINPPTINVAGNNTNICEGTTVQLSTNFGTSYSWSNGAGNTQQVNVGPGTYTVNVTYTNGCSATSAPVTINAAPSSAVSITANGPTSFCPGGSVELTANPAGAIYSWNTGQSSRVINVSSPGAYTATITPAGSCSGTANIQVSLLPSPLIDAGANVIITLGESTTLNATGALSYVWSPATFLSSTTGASVIATPNQTITYSVAGTAANGCVGNDQVTVNVVQPNASFSGLLATYCSNAQSSILVGTPAGGTFSGPGISGNIFNPANAGNAGTKTITYSVVNGLGETVTLSQTTEVKLSPQANIIVQGSATVCAPNTITLTANGGGTYQWAGGPSSAQFVVNSTGNYTVTVLGTNGCQATASQSVTINPQPLANITAGGPTTFCQGDQVILSSNIGSSYLWSPNGETTQNISVTASGTYSVQVTNAFGCSNISSPLIVNVTTNPTAPIIQINGASSICNGSLVTLNSNINNVEWFRQGNPTALGSGSSIQVNVAGNYFARLTATCGAVNSNVVQINESAIITPLFNVINPICAGTTAPILPQISNNGIVGTWNPLIVNNLESGVYNFTPNSGQCASVASISITVNPLPIVNAGNDVSITVGTSTTLNASGATTYLWSPSAGLNVNNSASVIATPNETTTYTVIGTNANGCQAQDQVTVTVNQPSTASFTGLAANYCLNASPSLLTGLPAGGVFSGPGISGNTFNPSLAGIGIKTITYTFSGAGGTIQSSQNTNVILAGNSTETVSICPGETYILPNGQAVGIGTYQTQTNNGNGCLSILSTTVNSLPTFTWYEDADDDGFGNPNVSQTGCTQPLGYVANSQDCNDDNPNINPTSQTLTFEGEDNFSNAITFPQTGSPSTIFTFKVKFTDVNGSLPPFGYPRAILDYEGNGVFNNGNDRTILLTELNASDLNTIDGKIYTGIISALTSGVSYQTRIQVQNNGCTTQIGPFNYPDVLTEPDLEIFANDISFSNPAPPVSSPLEITVAIRNISDFPAENFTVSLTNQFDPTIEYQEIIVPYLAANSSTNLIWNITTPNEPAWCPMEVFVDNNNVIVETNELDNRAVRPFINGNFILPGGIAVNASVSPSVQYVSPNASVTISGYADYFDTAVPLSDPSVVGAEVSLVASNGLQYIGTTNSSGFFSITIPISAAVPGTYSISGEVTDFTLTGPFEVSYQILPNNQPVCLPNLVASVALSDYQIFPNESINGTITVGNIGCAPTTTTTLLDITQTGGLPTINDVAVPPLAVGESFSTSFSNITFSEIGTYYICGTADASFLVEESNEANTGCASLQVLPPLPDIVGYSFNYGSIYLCNNFSNPSFTIANIGYVPTGSFDFKVKAYFENNFVQEFLFTEDNLNPQESFSFSIPFEFNSLGSYNFQVICDIPMPIGVVAELSELNNIGNVALTIVPCKPDLVVLNCGNLNVDPFDVSSPGEVTYSSKVINSGNAIALGPIEFNFEISNGDVFPVIYANNIAPGETVTFSTTAPAVESGDTILTAIVDPNNEVEEFYENNNQYADKLCWDFELTPPCGGLFPSTFSPNQTFIPYIGFRSNFLYKATEVKVRFEVSGPGISGTALLGDVTLNDVSKNCSCPTVVSLTNSFLFNEVGTYIFKFTVDPDNVYSECVEDNNVFTYPVNVTNFADYRILSQFINPTLLNPDVNESVFFDVTYENIGVSNALGQPNLSILIDEVPFANISNVPGLISGQNFTVAVPNAYSTDLPGTHVLRAKIDSQNEIIENDEFNNEATRAFVVGSAANLFFVSFEPSDASPNIGQAININAVIQNNGDLAVNADVRFSYLNDANNAIQIGIIPISLQPGQSIPISLPWNVLDNNTTLLGAIINVSELEFNPDDNFAQAYLGSFDVQLTSIPFCQGGTAGSITANASNGNGPYSYVWNTGFFGQTLQAVPGQYTVTVTDAQGFSTTSSGSIGVDVSCVPQTCQITPVSYNVSQVCNQNTERYEASLKVNYQSAPDEGFIVVNGINFDITGSPQTFNLSFGEGPVVFNVAFSEAPACSLLLVTGENRGPCIQPCPPNQTFNIFICSGEEYTLPNGDVVSSTGEYVQEFTQGDCVYSITTNLQVIPSGNNNINVNVCQGETYTLPNGDQVGAGEYVTTTNNGFGCILTTTTVVTEIQIADVNQSATICSGELYTLPNGVIVSPSETTTYNVPSNDDQTGCPYNIVFTVQVSSNPGNSTIEANICEGETYQLPNGQSVNSEGSYVVNLETTNGCPYIITVNLVVNPSPSSTVNVTINAGEAYTLPNGNIVSTAGQYITILQTEFGCNNTITTNLSIVNSPGGCYATSVIESNTFQGNRKNGLPVLAIRSNTSEALGAPDPVIVNVVNFYTLGFAGYLTVKFDQPVANGNGNDIKVYEATWNNNCANYPETAEVFGSQDGCNFLYMGNVCHSGEVAIPSEMEWIQYVQVRDISNPVFFSGNDDGFDVAAVECLHGPSNSITFADLTPGTLQDIPVYSPGMRKNNTPVTENRRDKNQAIGYPGGNGINFVSLGFGGSLVGKFDFVVFNKENLDLQVTETSYGNPSCNNYPEKAKIYASKNGVDYTYLGELCQDGALELGDLAWMQYVKIEDVSPISSSRFNGATDGFDVDAVVDLHACSNSSNSRVFNIDNITEPDEEWYINLYPNPTLGEANLELIDLPSDDNISLEILDATGRLLKIEKHQLREGKINIPIDLSYLANGSYQLRVNTSVGYKVLKLMKY